MVIGFRQSMLIVISMLLLAVSGTANATYYVFGGDSFSLDGNYWEKGYHPENFGYELIGTSTGSDTFHGTYNFYVITTYNNDVALIDSVQGSDGRYLNTYITGNTGYYYYEWDAPDGKSASVGYDNGFYGGGFMALDATGFSLSSITVYTTPIPPAWLLICSAVLGFIGYFKNGVSMKPGNRIAQR